MTDAKVWEDNVRTMLDDGDPDVIRAHEGGGPEDLVMSLVLTMARTRRTRDKLKGLLTNTLTPEVQMNLAHDVANSRQGQSLTPRCEAPSAADVGIANGWVRLVLAAIAYRTKLGAIT